MHMWNINVNATYYDYTNFICEFVVMKDCNNDAVLNKKECNAVISKYNIICGNERLQQRCCLK